MTVQWGGRMGKALRRPDLRATGVEAINESHNPEAVQGSTPCAPTQLEDERVSEFRFKFGDPVTAIWASDSNPSQHSYFVRRRYTKGRLNRGRFIEVTDKRGRFWHYPADSVARGHLSFDECAVFREAVLRPPSAS